jgi:PAS domain S-box-containing protein
MSILQFLFKLPAFEDSWQNLIATFLQRIMFLLLLVASAIAMLALIADTNTRDRLPYVISIIFWIIGALAVLKRGYLTISAALLLGGLWLVLAVGTLTSTGVYSPAYMSMIILIIIIGTALGNEGVLLMVLANMILGGLAVWTGVGNHMGAVAGVNFSPFMMWFFMSVIFLIIAAMVVTVRRTLVNMVNQMQYDSAFYRAIVNDQTELIVRWKTDRTRTFVNDAYCRYFGITREQAIGADFFPLLNEDDKQWIIGKLARLSPENPIDVDEHRVVRPDGTIGWQQWSDRAFYDEHGNLIGYQSVGRDITAIKELEVKERELAIAAERENLLRDFLSAVSHDLQTPLSVMRTNLYMIRKLTDPVKILDRANRIDNQIDKLSQMIGDILTVARLENAPQLNFAPSSISDILDITVAPLQDEAQSKRIQLDMTLQKGESRINADTVELQRAFTNLVQNAIKYTPTGGKICIEARQERGHVQVKIVDTGIGISEQDLPFIFDRFYRASNAQQFEKGTGLGLAISKRIIELHSGIVQVSSNVGAGTTFTVNLPTIR